MAKKDDHVRCELRHGIHLDLWSVPGRLTVGAVADFLDGAVEHFKHHRDTLKTERYEGPPYGRTAKVGRKVLGRMQLSCPDERVLTVAQWTEAVIKAYVCADTIAQMLEDLPAWRAAAEAQDGIVKEVVGLLGRQDGQLPAVVVWLKHDRTRAE